MGRDYRGLADAIKREYTARGWTQKQLAERAGISQTALTDLLKGEDHPRVPNSVAKIEVAFDWPTGTTRRILESRSAPGRHIDDAKRIADDMTMDDQIELLEYVAARIRRRRQNPE